MNEINEMTLALGKLLALKGRRVTLTMRDGAIRSGLVTGIIQRRTVIKFGGREGAISNIHALCLDGEKPLRMMTIDKIETA